MEVIRPKTPELDKHRQIQQQIIASTPNGSDVLERIKRDLSSPSATVRMRALNAFKNPNKHGYGQFEVPHAEQNIILPEERISPPCQLTLQELMRNIRVYVEVRTDEDNRTCGIKKFISSLGAQVNDKLNRSTTHVIFKDGLLSTYKKAKNLNIPIVSILWIEACKSQHRIVDPKYYPISNLDRYENPELYSKLKRFRSMQPDSECNKRIRRKSIIPKDATPKTSRGSNKKTLSPTGEPRTPVSSKNKKTDINQYFKQLNEDEKSLEDCAIEKTETTEAPNLNRCSRIFADSPVITLTILDQKNNEVSDSISKKKNQRNTNCSSHYGSPPFINNKLKQASTPKSAISKLIPATIKEVLTDETAMFDNEYSKKTEYIDKYIAAPTYATRHGGRSPKLISSEILKNNSIAISNMNTDFVETESILLQNGRQTITMLGKTPTRNKKRRTTFSNRTVEISELSDNVPKNATRNRRRTMYTPRKLNESFLNNEAEFATKTLSINKTQGTIYPNTSIEEATIEKSKQTIVILKPATSANESTSIWESSANLSALPCSTQLEKDINQDRDDSLKIENIQTPTVSFSSTRQPGRRKTMYNVMDIVSENVTNINRSSRRSVMNHVIDFEVRRSSTDQETPQSSKVQTEMLSAPIEQQMKAAGNEIDCINEESSVTPVVIKRRKLFNANDSPLPINIKISTKSCTAVMNSASATRRRKTLMPVTQPESDTSLSTKRNKTRTRRSTIEFEIEHKAKSILSIPPTENKTIIETGSNVTLNKGDNIEQRPDSSLPFLVYTNMHKTQVEVIREALQKLGGFQLENTVSNKTSHIVSLETRRTLNLLRALVQGLWILDYNWIVDSLNAGKWLYEEPYELKAFSRAVEICRTESHAFGKYYKCELFSFMDPFYVSSRCSPLSKDDLKDLITLCGGTIVNQRRQAKYILGNLNRLQDHRIYITPYWVLDSITHMQLQKLSKYICYLDVPTTETAIKYQRDDEVAPPY